MDLMGYGFPKSHEQHVRSKRGTYILEQNAQCEYSTRWANSSYKWSYNPYKWPYTWVSGVTTLFITPLKTGRGPPCMLSKRSFTGLSPKKVPPTLSQMHQSEIYRCFRCCNSYVLI